MKPRESFIEAIKNIWCNSEESFMKPCRQAVEAFADAECLARTEGGLEPSEHLLITNHIPCRTALLHECGLAE